MNKDKEILAELKKELESGKYKVDARFPSEHSLMNRFQASRITVNKVTEQLVMEGYLERGVKGSGTHVLNPVPFPLAHFAYIGPDSQFFQPIQTGLQEALFQEGCAVSIFYPVSTNVNKCIDCLSRSKYKGLFACAVGKLPDNFRLPVVYIDQGFSYSGHNHVICNDNYQGAFNMMQAVLSKGHRNVLISSTANEYIEDNRQQRLLGFTAAMKENGLLDTQQRQLKLAQNLSFATRCSIIKENIHRFGNISAIVTDSDNDAFTIMSVLHALGMEDRICVTGFGNIEVITKMYNLPSVEQFPQEMGIRAAMKMLSICRGEANASSLTEIETQLVNVEKIPEARN